MKKLLSIFFVFSFNILLLSTALIADVIEEIQKTLPKLLGVSNAGTEFVFGFHPCWEETGANNAIRIYVTSEYKTEVRLYIPYFSEKPYLVKTTIPNNVIEFVLSPTAAQPYTRGSGGLISTLQPTQVWNGRGIILESDAPIIAYGVTRFNYTSDGFLALPSNKCGTDYIISSYRETSNFMTQSLTPYASIIGITDSTKVIFYMGGNNNSVIKNKEGKTYKPYDTIVVTLNRGDYWLIASNGPQSDIGGSYVRANKPISVISGNHCAYVPTSFAACDYLIEQEIPVNFWGQKYYVSNIADRKKSSVIRIFVKEPNTNTMRNDNSTIAFLSQNYGVEGEGWIETRANPDTNLPTVILGDKPINVVQFNSGMQDDNVASDPFQMNVLPSSAFNKYFTFNTPGIRGGFGFRTNYLNLIYKPTQNKQIPDYLEIGEAFSDGTIKWTKVKDINSDLGIPFYENKMTTYYNKIIKLPYDAVYHIRSQEPIMAYLYGFADWDSYGFPISGFFYDSTVFDKINPSIEYKPIVSQINNNSSGTFIATDKDNNGNNNLAFAFVDTKNSFNVKHSIQKNFTDNYKLSSIKIDWNVINTKDSAKIVVHAVDNNGNISSSIQSYKPENPYPQKFIKISTLQREYFLNTNLKMNWQSNLDEKIKIVLLKDNNPHKTIVDSVDNNGEYIVFLDEKSFSFGDNYSIMLSGVLSKNITDTSNLFRIVSDKEKIINIKKPNELFNEYFQNESMVISWETYPENLKVKIEILDTLGKVYETMYNDSTPSAPREILWTIPYDFNPGVYKIRISDKLNPNIYKESVIFLIKFNYFIKKVIFLEPTDTTIAYIGQDILTKFKSNYFSNFQLWLSLDNTPIYKIFDNYQIKDTLMNNLTFRLPNELLINNKYSLTFIDKENFINKIGDVRFSSKYFVITKSNSIDENLSDQIISHILEVDKVVIKVNNEIYASKAELYDFQGKLIKRINDINQNSFDIPLNMINSKVIFVRVYLRDKIIDHKIILQ